MALVIIAEAFGFDSENVLFHRLHNECKKDLPNLISRRQFNARRKLTARLAEEIRREVAVAIDGSEGVFCIDSNPVKVCQKARAKRCVMGRDNIESAPDWGYCASQGLHYYGYMLGDKGYLSAEVQKYLFDTVNISLEVPYRLHQKNWRPPS